MVKSSNPTLDACRTMGKFMPTQAQREEYKQHMSHEQACAFESLYLAYWDYIYRYELKDIESLNPNDPWHKRNDFLEQLQEEAMIIKVTEGY